MATFAYRKTIWHTADKEKPAGRRVIQKLAHTKTKHIVIGERKRKLSLPV